MKKALVLALLAFGCTTKDIDAKKDHSRTKNLCCDSKELPKPALVNNLQTITITESGAYTFTENVNARIIIQANDVCLNLNNHAASFTSTTIPVIFGNNLNNLTIKNGTIQNPTGTGIRLTNTNQLLFDDLQFQPVQRAIRLENCTNGCIKKIDASNNTTQDTSLITLFGGHTFQVTEMNVSNCTLTRLTGSFGLVDFDNTDNVVVNCSKINKNTSTDRFSFYVFYFYSCDGAVVEDTEVNDNICSLNQSTGIFGIACLLGNNNCIKRCQVNRSTTNLSGLSWGISCQLINNLLIEDCEANGTTINTNATSFNSLINSGAAGIFLNRVNGFKILNTQANNTTHKDNQAGQNLLSGPEGIVILGSFQGVVKQCQANNTSSYGTNSVLAGGLLAAFSDTILIDDCEANNSVSDSGSSFGFLLVAPSEDITISNSTANNNKGKKSSSGFITSSSNASAVNSGMLFLNDSASQNSATDNLGAHGNGFYFEAGDVDCTVSNSYAHKNSGAGIRIGNLFSSVNPRIIRNCVKENTIGILVDGDNVTNGLVFENSAINNTACGFQEIDTPPTRTVSYLGNKAQGNTPDYCGITNFEVQKKDGKLCCDKKSDDLTPEDLANISLCPKPVPTP